MKKHLIAAGVVAAFAAPAMAQNVTIYGVFDVNYSVVDTDGYGSATAQGKNTLANSRLGLRGSEDLGGGLKAEFQLEGNLSPNDGVMGAATSSSDNANDSFFDREAWVGLSGKFGAIRMGRTDVTSAQAIDSKVGQVGNQSDQSDIGVDQKQVIRYTSPVWNGFQAEVGYANPEATTAASTGEKTAGKLTSYYVSYEQGPLGAYVGLTTQKITGVPSYEQDQLNVGAKYDFGVIAVGLSYSNRDGAGVTGGSAPYTAKPAADDKDYKQTTLSVSAPLSNGYKAHALYQKRDLGGSDATGVDYKVLTAVVTKALSKRTSLYAGISSKDFDKEAVGTTDADTTTYLAGVVHSF